MLKLSLILLCSLWLSGCADYQLYHSGKLFKAQTETQNEITELTKDYRQCLKAAIGDVEKQKGCGVYQQALLQLDVKRH